MFDALPLASEPFAAALDLVIAFVTGNFARGPAIALLRSPHFRFGPDEAALAPHEVSALDRALSEAGYLGDRSTLERLVGTWRGAEGARPTSVSRAADALLEMARRLAPLHSPAPCADHLAALEGFLVHYETPRGETDALGSRHRRGRAAVFDALRGLRDAYAQFDSRAVDFDETAAVTPAVDRCAHIRTEDRRGGRPPRRCGQRALWRLRGRPAGRPRRRGMAGSAAAQYLLLTRVAARAGVAV